MSQDDVAQVLHPSARAAADFYRSRSEAGERVVLALRRLLIATDPTLPSEYDGVAWAKIEATA